MGFLEVFELTTTIDFCFQHFFHRASNLSQVIVNIREFLRKDPNQVFSLTILTKQ
jgi:hypothetical protein